MPHTARSIVRTLQNALPPMGEKTNDVFHSVFEDVPIHAVVVTFQATARVLEEAVRRDAKLIVTHEPTFYQDGPLDDLAQDPIYLAKRAFIEKHTLSIWRCHDAWHRRSPDGINEGFVKHMGWSAYADEALRSFDLPATTLRELASELSRKLDTHVRVSGDLSMPVRKASISLGCAGWHTQRERLQRADVVICGEAREWETYEYARDSTPLGSPRGAIILGHQASEEPGMHHLAAFISDLVPDLPVHHVNCAVPFTTIA